MSVTSDLRVAFWDGWQGGLSQKHSAVAGRKWLILAMTSANSWIAVGKTLIRSPAYWPCTLAICPSLKMGNHHTQWALF
jgi:hypothetical protein